MAKRLFQLLDEMNVEDGEKGTALVGVCGGFIKADMTQAGTKVTMGAPAEYIHKLLNNEIIPILLLIDKKEYDKRSKS